MGAISTTANTALRDFVTAGVPASGDHEPVKSEVRAAFGVIDAALASLGVNGAITVKKATKALLDADLAHIADVLAIVYDDAVAANNGIYVKSGGSGSGSWAITDVALPSSFAADIATAIAGLEAIEASEAATLTYRNTAQTAASTAAINAGLTAADVAAADTSAAQAATAVELAGVSKFYDTKAAADADLAGIAANAVVHVWADENYSNARTAYRKEGGGLVFKKNLDAAWMASSLGGTVFYVDSYVDAANGVMADTLGLRAAIAAAGTNGVVRGKKGRTFTIYGAIAPLSGQTLEGFGGKIKRGDAITTTTTANVTSGVTTSVTVASATNLRVGMDIAIQSSATAGTGNRRISTIVGNTITVSAAFDATISSGATLTTSFACLENSGNVGAVVIRGWEINGNKANNAGFTRWPNHKEIAVYGTGCRVEHNYIHDCVGEGIEVGSYSTAEEGPCWCIYNRIEEANGNGIHTSATYAARINFNFVRNTNLQPNGAIGHDDGCISLSDYTGHTEVIGNHLENGKCGVGSIDAAWNGPVTISLNHIVDCDSAIEGVIPGGTVSRVIITDNLIEDSVLFSINETSADANDGARDWVVARNILINTALFAQRAQGLKLAGNIVAWTTDTTAVVFNLANCKNTEVENNRVTGGGYGIYIEGAGTAAMRLKGNDVHGQYTAGVWASSDCPVGEVDIENQGVFVASGVSTAAAWVGVQLCNGSALRGGHIKSAATSSSAGVVCPNGGTGVRGAIVTGMVIDAPSVTYAVRAGGGTKNNIVVGNFSDGSFSNAGGSDNTFANNYELTPV